jgi:Ca2+-binding RTX toxin-like protein
MTEIVVDRSTAVGTKAVFGHGPGPAQFEYAGQTFTAASDFLDSLEFYIGNFSGHSQTLTYRVVVTTVVSDANGFHPGSVLFESTSQTAPSATGPGMLPVPIDTGHLQLEAGQTYAFFLDSLDSSGSTDFVLGMSYWSPEGGSDYVDGHMIARDATLGASRADNFAAPWGDYNGADGFPEQADLQFKLTFSSNSPPSDIALSAQAVAEGKPTGTLVGALSATDPDTSSGFTYQLLNNAGGRFRLQGANLVVANGLLLDFEQAHSHQVQVRVTDSLGMPRTETFAITVGDINPETVTGNAGANTIFGGAGNDHLSGQGGADVLKGSAGNDVLNGGSGIDKLIGGLGRDTMTGGVGHDFFVFAAIGETRIGSGRDVINAFQHGTDDIDLRGIDARTGIAGNQAFGYVGVQAFHHVKGELRYTDQGATCLVQGDVNGDGKADFAISVQAPTLSASDFLL